MDRYTLYIGSDWNGTWIDKETDADGDWVKARDAFAEIRRLRAEVEALGRDREHLSLFIHRLIRRLREARDGLGTPAGDVAIESQALKFLRRRDLLLSDAEIDALRGEGDN